MDYEREKPITTERLAHEGRTSAVTLGLAISTVFSIVLLQVGINFPEILMERTETARLVFTSSGLVGGVGFIGLLISGILLWIAAQNLAQRSPDPAGRQIRLTGGSAALAWTLTAVGGLALTLFGNGEAFSRLYPAYQWLALILDGIAAPVLLALFTLSLLSLQKVFRGWGLIAASGILASAARSIIWVLNARLPVEDGHYAAAGILNELSILGEFLWLAWLVVIAWQPRKARGLIVSAALLLGLIFTLLVLVAPIPLGDQAPAEPSARGTLLYQVIWVYEGRLHPLRSVADLRAQAFGSSKSLPAGVSLENINASGVLAQFICAPGAGKERVIIYLHGGGFITPLTNQSRGYAAGISAATGACVLAPEYRLAPAHPFPAALQDSLTSYRWLLAQPTPPARIALIGDSAGASLVLSTALALRDSGEPLPAALVALSPATDLTMSGDTYQSKAAVDPILGNGLPRDAYAQYLDGNPSAAQNPLASPLFADLHGLPPALLFAGSQEVLLSDAQRMAARMYSAGDHVRLEVFPGMWHTWPLVGDFIPEAKLANQQIAAFLRQALGK